MANPTLDFGFGFNNIDFSDRVLQIEVTTDFPNKNGRFWSFWRRKSERSTDLHKENVVEVKTIHISSLLLAAKSPFFHKLFENGMRESYERNVTLRINVTEEAALMDIIKFMYTNTLSATTTLELLRVLIVADKFDVTCCTKYCSELLQNITMSLEYALSYLDLPENVLMGELVRPLTDSTKQYLISHYSDFKKSQKEVMDLPLCALEVVLGGGGLQVDSEDDVFDFVLEWARAHYPKLEERREILTKRLVKCICLSCMSCSKLKEALVSAEFDKEEMSKLVIDTLTFKVEVPYAAKDLADTKCDSLGRIYKLRPIKTVQMDLPQPRCFVYFDLRKEECENLFDSEGIFSERGHGVANLLGISWTDFMGEDCEYFVEGILHLQVDLTINNSED